MIGRVLLGLIERGNGKSRRHNVNLLLLQIVHRKYGKTSALMAAKNKIEGYRRGKFCMLFLDPKDVQTCFFCVI
jgi:hypothetical protein